MVKDVTWFKDPKIMLMGELVEENFGGCKFLFKVYYILIYLKILYFIILVS